MSVRKRVIASICAVAIAVGVVAFGGAGDARRAKRWSPGLIAVEQGEILSILIHNPTSKPLLARVHLATVPANLQFASGNDGSVTVPARGSSGISFQCNAGIGSCETVPFISPTKTIVSMNYTSNATSEIVELPAGAFRVV
jgi:hypothetical protein